MLFKYILNKIIFSVHLKFCKQYFIIGRAAGQSTSYAYYLKNVVQNKKSQWFIFFCAILYNINLKQKNKMPNTFSMQCLPLLFRVLKAKEIKKERNIVWTNELRNYFYLHFWFNKIFIKIIYWCIVFVFFEKKKRRRIYCVKFRLWCVMSSAITHFFLSELHNNRKFWNAFINDSSRSYWGRKRIHFYNKSVEMLLLSIIVIFHLFSTIIRVISNFAIRDRCYLNRYLTKLSFLFTWKIVNNMSS